MSEPLHGAKGAGAEGDAVRRVAWDRVLVWFMRVMAMVWILKGLVAWTIIIGVTLPGLPSFPDMLPPAQAIVVAFAVLDLLAAIGLWLTSTWGGVLWLLAVMTNVVIAVLRPVDVGTSPTVAGLQLCLVVAYVTLSWLASRDE
jgi:hypothetical protein